MSCSQCFLLKLQKGKRTLKPVMGSLEITPSGSKDSKQVQKVAPCSSLSLQGAGARKPGGLRGCSMQLNTLKRSIPHQISALGEHFSNTQVNVCQSKQTFWAVDKLPAQGEWSRLEGSRRVGLGCDGAWLWSLALLLHNPFPEPSGVSNPEMLNKYFLGFFSPISIIFLMEAETFSSPLTTAK